MSEFECGYCGADWAPVKGQVLAVVEPEDGEPFDEVLSGDECPNCGEFNGKAPREERTE